jgi:ribosomal protein S18 acetylase RimI-like enzyme
MYGTQDLGNALLQEHIESMHKREYKTLDIWLPERDDNVKQEVIEFFQNDGFFEEPDYNELFAAHDKQEE